MITIFKIFRTLVSSEIQILTNTWFMKAKNSILSSNLFIAVTISQVLALDWIKLTFKLLDFARKER